MISKKSKTKTLSDKICETFKAPDLQDPEDDIYEDTKAKTAEADSDFENNENLETFLSSFRKQNAKLLEDVDKKYAGKAVSRNSLFPKDESSQDSDDSSPDISVGKFVRNHSKTLSDKDSEEDISDEEAFINEEDNASHELSEIDSDNDSKATEDGSEMSDDNSEYSEEDFDMEDDLDLSKHENKTTKETDFKHVSGDNASEAVQKGNAVRQQLHIWEKLMEIRICSQKVLLSSNKLPRYDEYSDFCSQTNPEVKEKVQESKKLLTNLLNKFLDVQMLLLKKYPETKNLLQDNVNKINVDMDAEIPSDTEDEAENISDDEVPTKKRKISDFPKIISEMHEKYTNYRNDVMQKWHDKVRVASGVMNHKNFGTSSLLQHIQYVLLDKERLRKRTQIKRSNYKCLSLKPPAQPVATAKEIEKIEETNDIEVQKVDEEYDPEIFDDDDFYHQLLRELIEYKTANVTDPVQLSKQWIELQQLRNKMKRKIDTKATKGRRIRYSVHPKLVNFMAPEENSMWTDEAKDELFGSLFGKKMERIS